MFDLKVTGTIFVALILDAAIFYFIGGSFKSIGENTGKVAFSDVGQGGINIGLFLIGLVIFFFIIFIIIFIHQQSQSGGY